MANPETLAPTTSASSTNKVVTPPPPQPVPSTIATSESQTYYAKTVEPMVVNHIKSPPAAIARTLSVDSNKEESEKSISRQSSTVSRETIEVARIEEKLEKSEAVPAVVVEEAFLVEHKIEKVKNVAVEERKEEVPVERAIENEVDEKMEPEEEENAMEVENAVTEKGMRIGGWENTGWPKN